MKNEMGVDLRARCKRKCSVLYVFNDDVPVSASYKAIEAM